jgi:hypothetical protein
MFMRLTVLWFVIVSVWAWLVAYILIIIMTGWRMDRIGGCVECPARSNAVGGAIGLAILLVVLLLILYYMVIIRGDDVKGKYTIEMLQAQADFDSQFDAYHARGSSRRISRQESASIVTGGSGDRARAGSEPVNTKPLILTPEARAPRTLTYNLKIIVGFLQVATALTILVDTPWPTGFSTFVSAFDIVNLSFIPWESVECATDLDWYIIMAITGAVPLLILIVASLVFFPTLWICEKRDFGDDDSSRTKRKRWRQLFSKALLFTLFLVFPAVSSRVLGLFHCRDVNGTSYLVADFKLQCGDDRWHKYLGLAVVYLCMLLRRPSFPFSSL